MKINLSCLLAFLLLSTSTFGQKVSTETLEIGNASKIKLSHEYAQVKIKTWDKSYVEVNTTLDIPKDQYDVFKFDLDKRAQTIHLTTSLDIEKVDCNKEKINIKKTNTTTTDDGQCTNVTYVNGIKVGCTVEVSIEIYVPKGLAIEAESTFGSIKAYDIQQKINIQNTYADVQVIFDKLIDGSSLESTYASVDIHIPKKESAQIYADTGFGKIYSDLEDYEISNEEGFHFGQEATLKLGGGAKSLRLDSGYQNIYIRTEDKLPRISN